MNFDSRFSLASLAVAVTCSSVLLALITLAPASFWQAVAEVSMMLALLVGLAGVILVASLLFIGAVLLTGFAAILLVRAVVAAIGRRVAWSS